MTGPRLFLNVDHVATVRQARKSDQPDPVEAALLAEASGHIDGITVHLREDRRHIQDRDITEIRKRIRLPFNFEMSCAPEIVDVCVAAAPAEATLVPERRAEVTTEGGLDLIAGFDRVAATTRRLKDVGIAVSLFIDPTPDAVARALRIGATHVELHTGRYCDARPGDRAVELAALRTAATAARALGLIVNAGHGLSTANVGPVAAIPGMHDLNIGHAIIARAIMVGLPAALAEIRAAMRAGNTAAG